MVKRKPKNKQELSPKSGTGRKRKKKAAPKKRNSRVPKTRNHNSMTESAFFGWIKNLLRAKSRYWKPVQECKKRARRAYTGTNKRQKFEYQCNSCKNWFKETEISVDHVIPVGSLKCFDDLPGVVERLFCEVDGLQCLCKSCHSSKTKEDLKTIRIEVCE